MSMKPILFNTEMVKAIMEGRKTVTRRIADINADITCNDGTTNHEFVPDNFNKETPTGFVCRRCGFGVAPPNSRVPCGTSIFRPRYWPGDILYVRETWTKLYYADENGYTHYDQPMYFYAADGDPGITLVDADGFELDDQRVKWKPSIHMPKEAARIFLRVKRVSVERLQDITEADATKEGVPDEWPMNPVYCPVCQGEGLVGSIHPGTLGYMEVDCPRCAKATQRFANLWDSTIKTDDLPNFGWVANPWAWVIEFERCEKPKEA